jgi:hypothetical protein
LSTQQDRTNAAKQISEWDKNMVMIGAGQINNTINENAMAPGTIKEQPRKVQGNATTTSSSQSSKIRTGSFIGAYDGFHDAEGLAKVIPIGDGNLQVYKWTQCPSLSLPIEQLRILSILKG